MSQDLLGRFLAAPPRQRLKMASDPANAAALEKALGAEALADYGKLASKLDESHLAADTPPNLIFVPGVMGSLLMSRSLGGVWWIDARARHHFDDLRLRPDGRGDADAAHKVESFAVDISYEGFFAGGLATPDFGHIGCHYDWRKPLGASTHRLVEDIATARHDNGGKPVDIIAHSMGGLLVRETLRRHPDLWDQINRIVFIATPHYGSPSIAWYLKNHLAGFNLMAVLGRYLSRATFRSLWGAISLLPAPRGVYPATRENDPAPWQDSGAEYVHPCANFDMYDADAWQLEFDAAEGKNLQAVLDGAAQFHRDLYAWHLKLDQTLRNRMAVIAGIGLSTLFRLAYNRKLGFLWEHMEKTSTRIEGDIHRDGDGRVPLASATLESIGELRFACGEHSKLPCMPAVYMDAFRFLRGVPMQLPDTPAGALQSHLAFDAAGTDAASLVGAAPPGKSPEDPGYLQFDAPDPAALEAAAAKVEAEQEPRFRFVRLL